MKRTGTVEIMCSSKILNYILCNFLIHPHDHLQEANFGAPAANLIPNNFEPNPIPSIQHIMPSSGAVSLGAPKGMMPLANNNLCPQPVPFSSRPVAQPGLPEPALQGLFDSHLFF